MDKIWRLVMVVDLTTKQQQQQFDQKNYFVVVVGETRNN